MIYSFVVSVFFLCFFSVWLMACFLISLISFLRPSLEKEISIEKVKNVPTVCGILHKKKKLTDEEYTFEAEVVAPFYDAHTFEGYRLIMIPVLKTMDAFAGLDRMMVLLVYRWIRIHKYLVLGEGQAKAWELGMTKLCTGIAKRVGITLEMFHKKKRLL